MKLKNIDDGNSPFSVQQENKNKKTKKQNKNKNNKAKKRKNFLSNETLSFNGDVDLIILFDLDLVCEQN